MVRRAVPFLALACAVLVALAPLAAQGDAVTLRAPLLIDGRGGQRTNALVTIAGGKITAVADGGAKPTYDLTGLTLLPGFIDTHVHIGWHFGPDDRFVSGPEPPDTAALYGAENAYVTLMAGFTTVQSVGAASDKALRTALARGILPGPRLLSSLGQITNNKLTPDQLREEVRKKKAEGADLVKIFASASIRDGGVPTMSQEQLDALCGEAKAQGLRSMVHAHAAESDDALGPRRLHGGRARRAGRPPRRWRCSPRRACGSIPTSGW